jgi:hypothetical protein
MRAWYLNEARGLESDLDFSTTNFVSIPWQVFNTLQGEFATGLDTRSAINLVDQSASLPKRGVHPDIVDYYASRLGDIMPAVKAWTQSLEGDAVIVRPSPLDEHTYSGLSFAGVYKSYMPRPVQQSKAENLLLGTASVLAGRFTQYGNSYYNRQGINTDRLAGIMYMQPFFDMSKDAPLFHGTAYVAGRLIRNEYVISPSLDQPQRDPRLMTRWNGDVHLHAEGHSAEDAVDFSPRMTKLLDGLHTHFKAPLDVEYLIDEAGRIFVVQIRRISEKHVANWERSANSSDMDSVQDSAIVNTVGTVEGKVVDLRHSVSEVDLTRQSGAILVINHENTTGGMHTQTLLDTIRVQRPQGLKIVVDHGEKRVRDHLQYAVVEDPSIDFVLQTSDRKFMSGLTDRRPVRIESNGLSGNVVRL